MSELRVANPRLFELQDENAVPCQQDATEAWNFLMMCFKNDFGTPISNFFEIEFDVTSTIDTFEPGTLISVSIV
jgi:hypothetical protein